MQIKMGDELAGKVHGLVATVRQGDVLLFTFHSRLKPLEYSDSGCQQGRPVRNGTHLPPFRYRGNRRRPTRMIIIW